jgi:hypothetical protein
VIGRSSILRPAKQIYNRAYLYLRAFGLFCNLSGMRGIFDDLIALSFRFTSLIEQV